MLTSSRALAPIKTFTTLEHDITEAPGPITVAPQLMVCHTNKKGHTNTKGGKKHGGHRKMDKQTGFKLKKKQKRSAPVGWWWEGG